MDELLLEAAHRALSYQENAATTPVRPEPGADLSPIDGPLPEEGTDADGVIKLIYETVTPATMTFSSPRFFGWVIGGVYPVALAADWMTSGWDQNSVFYEASPGTVRLEAAALRWVKEAVGLPESSWGAFVTGTTVGNAAALAAARTAVLNDAGMRHQTGCSRPPRSR